MSIILLSLDADVSFDATTVADATLGADVAISPVTPAPLMLDIDILTEVGQQYQPRGQVVQRPYVRVEIDEFTPLSAVRMNDMTGPFSIERTLTQGTQWSMGIAIGAEQPGILSSSGSTPANSMPVELELKAPPPALAKVHVYGGYWLTDGTAFEQLLVSDGIAASSSRKFSLDGHTMEINGLGPEGRWDRALASLNLEPNHNLTHGELIELLAIYVGVATDDIAIGLAGSPRQKALNICHENWWSAAQEIAEAAILVPYWERSGILVLQSLFGDQSGMPEFVFTDLDIMADVGIDIQSEADVPTCITVQGTREAEGGLDGTITRATFVETFKDYAIPKAAYGQSSTGVVSAYGSGGKPEEFQLVNRISTIDEIRNGCLVVRNTYVDGYYNPQLWKYSQDTAGAPEATGYNDAGYMFLEDGDGVTAPTAGDNTPLRRWYHHKWVETSGERLSYPRWSINSQIHTPTNPEADDVGPIGYKLAEVSAKRGWNIIENPIKERTGSSTTWEVTDFTEGQKCLADGRGFGNHDSLSGRLGREEYCNGPGIPSGALSFALGLAGSPPKSYWIPRSNINPTFVDVRVVRWIVDACGFILRESEYESFPSADLAYTAAGTQYFYKDGTVSGDYDRGRRWRGLETDYISIGESDRRAVSSAFEDGQVTTVEVKDEEGYLPAAENCGLDRSENMQDLEATVCSLEDVHEDYKETVSNDFIESIEEARALGEAILRDAQAVAVSFTLSAVWSLEPGMKVQVYLPKAKLSHPCIVDRVRWYRSSPGGPILTNVVGKILVS